MIPMVKFQTAITQKPVLDELEKDSFIQIIMGVKPVSYFDEFVETWYEEGGEELTQQIRKSNSGK